MFPSRNKSWSNRRFLGSKSTVSPEARTTRSPSAGPTHSVGLSQVPVPLRVCEHSASEPDQVDWQAAPHLAGFVELFPQSCHGHVLPRTAASLPGETLHRHEGSQKKSFRRRKSGPTTPGSSTEARYDDRNLLLSGRRHSNSPETGRPSDNKRRRAASDLNSKRVDSWVKFGLIEIKIIRLLRLII